MRDCTERGRANEAGDRRGMERAGGRNGKKGIAEGGNRKRKRCVNGDQETAKKRAILIAGDAPQRPKKERKKPPGVVHGASQPVGALRDGTRAPVFQEICDYFSKIFKHSLSEYDCTFLIRRSTNRFCVELVRGGVPLSVAGLDLHPELAKRFTKKGLEFLAGEDSDSTVIDSVTLKHYHSICYWEFAVYPSMWIASSATVHICGVFNGVSEHRLEMVEIAWLPNAKISSDRSWHCFGNGRSFSEIMANGWTRLKSTDIVDSNASVEFYTDDGEFWLSQANHIFTALQISSDFQHYECPAYWSLDSSGAERLTPEDAADFGFPSFVLSIEVPVFPWDASVYAGLRQLHQAKGCDPDSQDVARHLGDNLYELSGPFAHIDEYSEDGDDTSQWSTGEELDDEPDSTNHVLASTHQNMEQVPFSSAFGDIVDSTSASTASSLFSINWESLAAGTGYSYDNQPDQYLATSDLSPSDINFDAYNFGNDLFWLDYSAFNDTVPSAATLHYQPPMFHNAAQFFHTTSFPQLHTSLPAASSFPIAPVVDAPVASSNMNYQPPMLHNAAEFFPATSFPQFSAGLLDTSSFHIAPIFDAPVAASNLIYQPPMLIDAAQLFHTTPLPQLPTSLPVASFFPIAPVVDSQMIDTPSTTSRKRKTRDETDLVEVVQGTRAQKAPKRFHI
ncbi:hypothetical protein C8R45DRAFT_920262 [Mycena sanguinolenta]|nr:hypothetical protein C8R45DRAFT_920262 [Mycena sanguinolenta]